MKTYPLAILTLVALTGGIRLSSSAESATANPASPARPPARPYLLTPNDMVWIKVYQEPDLETKARIARDGTISFPLIGAVTIGGKTPEQAAALIGARLDQDYLVNPQVTLTVSEFSKRRFTVLGQVQRPGAYEIPNEETLTLFEAIAMAGGYTRLANPSRLTITRTAGERKININLDAKAMAKNPSRPFEIMPDDTITVDERIF